MVSFMTCLVVMIIILEACGQGQSHLVIVSVTTTHIAEQLSQFRLTLLVADLTLQLWVMEGVM